MKRVFLTLIISATAVSSAQAQLSNKDLTQEDREFWNDVREFDMRPDGLDEVAFCSVIWDDWAADLKASGNSFFMPDHLYEKSAETHLKAWAAMYEIVLAEEKPEWVGKSESMGPTLQAMDNLADTKEYRAEYFGELAYCFRDDLFQKSREN